MRKPIPTPEVRFVFHPEEDTAYRHFDGHEQAPFAAKAKTVTRANAWWLAESALLTYWNSVDAVPRFAVAGLSAELVEDSDTQAYLAWSSTAVFVCFRGTQPGRVADILADGLLVLVPWKAGSGVGFVHLGFREALENVWSKLMDKLRPLATSRTVWFGGHSLGAALATLAADRYPDTAGVCTLGSPRVGDKTFADHFDARFGPRALRYVNDTDVVTHLPTPFPLPYKHVGGLRHIASDGRITATRPPLAHFVRDVFGETQHVVEISEALNAGALRTAPDYLLDHMPRAYTVHIWNDFDAHGD
ncbi:MAG: lipase family protein [Acidobacteriota bacterium]